MGKKVSLLVPFLREALKSCKYGTALTYVDQVNEIFEVNLTRKSTSMNKDSVKLLKDWNSVKHREFNFKGNYSVAKQRFFMALKRSKYLKLVCNGKAGIQYRFSTEKEIEAETKSETLQVNMNHSSTSTIVSTSPIEMINSPSFGVEITSSSSSSDVENFNSQSDCSSEILGRIFREFNDQNSQHSTEISHGLQSEETTFLDIFNHPDDRESFAFDARLVSDDQWKEVEEYLYDSKKSKPRGTEQQLYHYKDEITFGNIILCELEEDERHSFDLENAEFLKGCPGVIANVDFLKKLLSCHIRIMKLKRGHLLLYLTPISDRVTYTTHVFSDKLIFKNAEYFILYCDNVTTLDQFSPSTHDITK